MQCELSCDDNIRNMCFNEPFASAITNGSRNFIRKNHNHPLTKKKKNSKNSVIPKFPILRSDIHSLLKMEHNCKFVTSLFLLAETNAIVVAQLKSVATTSL